MVAKLNSSSVLQTEGQVMAERPKNNCFFAAPNHPGNKKLRLSETVCSVQNSYKEYLHDLLSLSQETRKQAKSPEPPQAYPLTTVPPPPKAHLCLHRITKNIGETIFQTSGKSGKGKPFPATSAFRKMTVC